MQDIGMQKEFAFHIMEYNGSTERGALPTEQGSDVEAPRDARNFRDKEGTIQHAV
jgi:hypothetical protein